MKEGTPVNGRKHPQTCRSSHANRLILFLRTSDQDLWNEASGTGSQCTTVDTLSSDDILTWSTSWTWSGNSSQVKSYANIVTNFTITTLAEITSIPSLWSWTYSGTDLVADVSYDMFTSSSATGTNEYEIMVWLDALGGAGPISSTGSAVATPTVAGTTWDLYDGYNGDTHVFSFVASSGAVADFDGDLYDFLSYLVEKEGMESSQYLLSIGAGSEPFTGSDAVFSVASYSCGVSTGGSAATTSAAAVSSSSAVVTSVEASTTSVAVTTSSSAVVVSSAASSVASDTIPAITSTASAVPSASQPAASGQAPPSQASGSHSQGGAFPSGQGSKPSETVTTAALTTSAASSAAEPATTLATSTKKSCHKQGPQ